MQMFIAFNPEESTKSKDVLVYFAHCLNAEIREGNIGHRKGWMFIFKDELRPFRFGGKRKYTVEDENAVAEDIRNGKSLRKIAGERHMAVTTANTLYKRYLSRNPKDDRFPVRDQISGSDSANTDLPNLREAIPSEEEVSHPETYLHTSPRDMSDPFPIADTDPPNTTVSNP